MATGPEGRKRPADAEDDLLKAVWNRDSPGLTPMADGFDWETG
jgi:hypothetical protein